MTDAQETVDLAKTKLSKREIEIEFSGQVTVTKIYDLPQNPPQDGDGLPKADCAEGFTPFHKVIVEAWFIDGKWVPMNYRGKKTEAV
jgi:hypothetical protein